jgi:hypothetical protein
LGGNCHLMQVVDASDRLSLLFGLGQRRQQQRREDRDDGNDHEQFDQCETQSRRPTVGSFAPAEEPGCPARRAGKRWTRIVHIDCSPSSAANIGRRFPV